MKDKTVKNIVKLLLGSIILLCFATVFVLFYNKQLLSNKSFKVLKAFISTNRYTPVLPTINTVFSQNHTWTATLSAEHVTTIIATGDVIPARSVNFKANSYNNFKWAVEKTADFLKTADVTFINLETPLLKNCPVTQKGMIFCGNSHHIEGLVEAGVDIASLANNHAGNHGKEGVLETIEQLNNAGIEVTGTATNNIIIKTVRGIRFAFLGFNDIEKLDNGISNADENNIKTQIQNAKQQADVVIVTYHWGVEYRDLPDDRQIYLAHFTIDSGADLVIGNHPHWIQPIEFYKGKFITYAHGNFVFDQMWSEETKKGVVGKYTFYNNELIDVEYFPVYIEDFGQPSFLEGDRKEQVLKHMEEGSITLGNRENSL